jgi:Ca-activated chloride channel family protein
VKDRTLYPLPLWVWWALGVPLGLVAVGVTIVAITDAATIPFDNPHHWWLLGAVPVAGLFVLYGAVRKRQAVYRFTSEPLASLLLPSVSPARQSLRAGLVVLAAGSTAAAILGPRWGVYMEKQTVRGVDIVIALDVSRSMLATDIEPNRLERAKREIRQQLTERAVFGGTNRLALLAFAGSTSLKVPLTTDQHSFRTRLDQIHYGDAPQGGTAIAGAIRAASDLLSKSSEDATKLIILFTDGEDHEGGPIEAAQEVRSEGNVLVFTVGVGDPSRTVGAQIPADDTTRGKPLIHDGQIVFSKLDVESLRAIAQAGGGRYAPVEDLFALVNSIARLHRVELTTEQRERHRPQYQWFLAFALLCLALETMIAERRTVPSSAPLRTWQKEAA